MATPSATKPKSLGRNAQVNQHGRDSSEVRFVRRANDLWGGQRQVLCAPPRHRVRSPSSHTVSIRCRRSRSRYSREVPPDRRPQREDHSSGTDHSAMEQSGALDITPSIRLQELVTRRPATARQIRALQLVPTSSRRWRLLVARRPMGRLARETGPAPADPL